MPKADKQLTQQRQFVERKSYITKDGREVLYGLDWKRRVKQLEARCGGRCEYMIPDLAEGGVPEGFRCAREAAHPHHRVKRSKGRDDRLENLVALCKKHHRQQHPEKEPMWTRRGAVRDEGVST